MTKMITKETHLKRVGPLEATSFRGMAARYNYLSADRPDIVFPVKELCREMRKPTVGSMTWLKRLERYLKAHPRLVRKIPWQAPVEKIYVHTDANWDGCEASRTSTSGGTIMREAHLIKARSNTQDVGPEQCRV